MNDHIIYFITAGHALTFIGLIISWKKIKQQERHHNDNSYYKKRQVGYEFNISKAINAQHFNNCYAMISNRDSRDIVITELRWSLNERRYTWELKDVDRQKVEATLPKKLNSADYLKIPINIDEIMDTCTFESASPFQKISIIYNLRMYLRLSTGEEYKIFVVPELQYYLLNKYIQNIYWNLFGQFRLYFIARRLYA